MDLGFTFTSRGVFWNSVARRKEMLWCGGKDVGLGRFEDIGWHYYEWICYVFVCLNLGWGCWCCWWRGHEMIRRTRIRRRRILINFGHVDRNCFFWWPKSCTSWWVLRPLIICRVKYYQVVGGIQRSESRKLSRDFWGRIEFQWNYPTQSTRTEGKLFGQRTVTFPEKGWEKKSREIWRFLIHVSGKFYISRPESNVCLCVCVFIYINLININTSSGDLHVAASNGKQRRQPNIISYSATMSACEKAAEWGPALCPDIN